MPNQEIMKRFPTTVPKLNEKKLFFLNDKKVDAKLYAFYQQYSHSEPITDDNPDPNKYAGKVKRQTYIDMKQLSPDQIIASSLNMSLRTLQRHRKYLIENGYLLPYKEKKQYILANVEDYYLLVPNRTLKYFTDVFKEDVLKTYLCLGVFYNYKQKRTFTLEELGNAVGIAVKNHSEAYEKINNYLTALKNEGFIDYKRCYKREAHSGEIKGVIHEVTFFSFYHREDQVEFGTGLKV